MRQFDTLQSYLDNDGNVLVGRAKFCDLKGKLKQILDRDGNIIDSIVFTDSAGRLASQVFLLDSDYKVVFEKYVGDTSMTDEEDDSYVWEFQFESISLYDTFSISVDTEGEQCLSSMQDLRNTDPRTIRDNSGKKLIRLLGYREAGDKPSVIYLWDPDDSSSLDNGGSVIKYDGMEKGRWHIIPDFTSVDVRHFGVFPNETPSRDDNQIAFLSNAMAFCRRNGMQMFFPVLKNGVYYDITNLSLVDIDCSQNARLVCQGGQSASVTNVKNAYATYGDGMDGQITITSDEVRTSFNPSKSRDIKLVPRSRMILDTGYIHEYVVRDVEVVVESDQTDIMAFVNCTFSGNGKFVNNVRRRFRNCTIRQGMFSENYDYGLTEFFDCDSDPGKWDDIESYAEFCIKNRSRSIDLNGGTVSKDFRIKFSTEIRNGTIKNLYVEDPEGQSKVIDLSFENVVATLKNTTRLKSFTARDSSFDSSSGSDSVSAEIFYGFNSLFGCDVYASSAKSVGSTFSTIHVVGCQISDSYITSGMLMDLPSSGVLSGISVSSSIFSPFASASFSVSAGSQVSVSEIFFVNNIMQGTKRKLVSNDSVISSGKITYHGNVNAAVDLESSYADRNDFNTAAIYNLIAARSELRKINTIEIDTDRNSVVNPPDESRLPDGTIFFRIRRDGVYGNVLGVDMYARAGGSSFKINS